VFSKKQRDDLEGAKDVEYSNSRSSHCIPTSGSDPSNISRAVSTTYIVNFLLSTLTRTFNDFFKLQMPVFEM
jgi:hypothetical protein